MLTAKYGKPFAETARSATSGNRISEKLMHKMAIQAPPKLLVEKYLIEIANIYNIEYEPDPQVMEGDKREIGMDGYLIDLSDKNNLGGGGSGGGIGIPVGLPPSAGFIGYPQPPPLPDMPMPPMTKPFEYPPPGGGFYGGNSHGGGPSAPQPSFINYNIPPNPHHQPLDRNDIDINQDFLNVSVSVSWRKKLTEYA